MLEITFEIDGEKLSVEDISENILLHDIANDLRQQLGTLVCKEHGEAPEIMVNGDSPEELFFEVSGCCDAIIDTIRELYE